MLFDDFTRKRSERKFQFVGIPVSEEYRNLTRQQSRLTGFSQIEEYEQKWSRKQTGYQVI